MVQTQWYTWRYSLIVPLVDFLLSISDKLSNDIKTLELAIQEVSSIFTKLNVDKISLSNQFLKLEEKFRDLTLFDWDRHDELTELLKEADITTENITRQLTSNVENHNNLQAELLSIQIKKDSIVSKIDAYSHELDDLSEISKLDADLAKGFSLFFYFSKL